jgi:transposase
VLAASGGGARPTPPQSLAPPAQGGVGTAASRIDNGAMELTLARMRGTESKQSSMLCLMSPESVVPAKHPLRKLKPLADQVLGRLSPTFEAMYSSIGRPSIPPERLLKATVLMALYSVRSERMFCEQLGYNLLFRWFLDMNMTEPGFDHSTFSRNRGRLLAHDVANEFFTAVVQLAREEDLLSDEHFSVDGTLIEAWASLKSFRPKEPTARDDDDDRDGPGGNAGNRWVDFHGEKRTNETHESKTDPEARLARKGCGKEAKLSYSAHALMENRNGILMDLKVDEANGRAERERALAMIDARLPGTKPITLGADKGDDAREFVEQCRSRRVVPHVAQNQHARRRSAIDARTTRHGGYVISQRIRKRIEEVFGWAKTVGNFRRTRFRGRARTQLAAYFVGAAYNLLRIAKLLSGRQPPPLPEGA